jgi:hypothetical protein
MLLSAFASLRHKDVAAYVYPRPALLDVTGRLRVKLLGRPRDYGYCFTTRTAVQGLALGAPARIDFGPVPSRGDNSEDLRRSSARAAFALLKALDEVGLRWEWDHDVDHPIRVLP